MAIERRDSGSVSSATLWMFILSILLFWLPILGPLVAGFVGGRKAGDTGSALVAAILPAIIIGALAFLVGALFSLPILGALAGVTLFLVVVFHSIWLLAGALVGGATA